MLNRKLQKNEAHPDYILLVLVSFLVLWGTFTVGNISFPLSLQKYGQVWHYLLHQLLMLAIGIVLAVFSFKFPLKTLKKWAPFLFFLNLILVVFVFLPEVGVKVGGARRWFSIGGFLFQPSEFLKITFILYLSSWLSERQRAHPVKNLFQRQKNGRCHRLNSNRVYKKKKFSLALPHPQAGARWREVNQLLLPFLIILVILVIFLILQPDMSTLGIICFVGLSMYFAAATPWWHTLLMGVTGIAGGILLVKFTPYRLNRLLVFLKPEIDPLGIGYQLRQAKIALGSGKILGIDQGLNFGLSRQKFGFLPHPMTDSIFAIIGEEIGFIGAAFLIFLFLLFTWRGLKVAVNSKENFEKLLALGIIVWLTFQAFFNIGGIIGILPLAGIPLPFFSYGGSHLIAELIGVGILLNISRSKT